MQCATPGPPADLLSAGLEHISISRCNYVSNVGFSLLLLSPLPHLKRIVVRKCPGVTEDGLREIAAKKVQELPHTSAHPKRASSWCTQPNGAAVFGAGYIPSEHVQTQCMRCFTSEMMMCILPPCTCRRRRTAASWSCRRRGQSPGARPLLPFWTLG